MLRLLVAVVAFLLVAGLAWLCAAAAGVVWGTRDAGVACVLGSYCALAVGVGVYLLSDLDVNSL